MNQFYIVFPFDSSKVVPDPDNRDRFFFEFSASKRGDAKEVVKVRLPMCYTPQAATNIAAEQALTQRFPPVIAKVIQYAELPKDVAVVIKEFTEDGEVKVK